MKKLKEIKLNDFQLNVLLNEQEQEEYKFLLQDNVYCPHCKEVCEDGIEVTENILNWLNDILVKGKCRKCGKEVNRFIELGEDKEFFDRANAFRRSIGNLKD